MFWTLVLGLCLFFIIWEWLRPNNKDPSKPGQFFYTKKWLFQLLLALNSRRGRGNGQKPAHIQTDRTKRGFGKSLTDPEILESCQPLIENDPYSIDTTYFNGFGEDGTCVALRIARKPQREGELWVLLDIPGVGFLQHPLHPDAGVYNMGPGEYRAGGCKFEMIEPMRRWKVNYNGLLRHGLCIDLNTKPEKYLNVKLSLKWECMNDPFSFDIDLDKSLLAEAVAKETWTKEFWEKLRNKHQTHYEQCGELSGTIEIEGHPTRHVYLKSFRDHTFGYRDWNMFYRYTIHFIWVPQTGVMAMVAMLWMPDYITFLKTGYLMYANGSTYPVTGVEVDIHDVTKDSTPLEKYSFTFTAGGESFHVDLVTIVTPELYHYPSRASHVFERFCTYTVNGLAARGLTEYHYRNPEGPAMEGPVPMSVPLLQTTDHRLDVDDNNIVQLVIPFSNLDCTNTGYVGGKGTQLALLASIQKEIGVKVPAGFCINLTGLNLHIKTNQVINNSIDRIVKAVRENQTDDLQRVCSDTVELLAGCRVCQPIEKAVTDHLEELFGDEYQQVSLAVRSSAYGEDGSEASSAGQMETYLGVKGLDGVMEAIQKCLASAYTYQAVEYRRQHGQPIRAFMGVVIQEMVQSEVSGVLFTNNPITGSPNRMVIDASYGLGEVVVSGKTTPDSIIVLRHHDNSLVIQQRNLGNKNISLNVADTGGVCVTTTDESAARTCCLTDVQILQLCRAAIQVEEYFGSARDIEWAICKDTIYLLQARPITTLEQDRDEDLIHEFDSPIPTGWEYLTLGNIGEMMPGCVTPLTGSVFTRAVDLGTTFVSADLAGESVCDHPIKTMVSSCGRLFINLTVIASKGSNSVIFNKNGMELNLIGEVLEDHTWDQIKTYGHVNKSLLSKLYTFCRFFYLSRQKCKIADAWYDKLKTYDIGAQCDTAADLYRDIDQKIPDYTEVWITTIQKSGSSGFWGGILMSILSQGKDGRFYCELKVWITTLQKSGSSGLWNSLTMNILSQGKDVWTTDNYSDIALMLSQCKDVYSAEVPVRIQSIAAKIVDSGVEDYFLQHTDTECVSYLVSEDCPSDLREMYQTFIERHGHRCIREAEFLEKSWRSEPEKLIKVIKAILQSKGYMSKAPPAPDLDEMFRNIKSPISSLAKFLLKKWIVPNARKAVGQREFGKSVAITMNDKFKQAYWRLSDMLVNEGILPEAELLFFLTHREIHTLIHTRSARLITRAIRRRKILPIQTQIEFPRLFKGRPQPTQSERVEEQRKASFTLNGMPVSHGTVNGTARVIKSLEEAASIQKGDILIVCYTDVGWSPYFPLISGLVTEMGGLVSHGAVVAREYGLPCVVNVPRATQLLKTGDSLRLDGVTGCIQKLDDV